MGLHCSGLPAVQRADLWACLAAFFAQIVPPGDPRLGSLRENGDMERARACLRYALAFDTARNGNREWRGSGHTHLLLARVHRALGDRQAALTDARNAGRLLAADAPAGPSRRAAEALLRELELGSRS